MMQSTRVHGRSTLARALLTLLLAALSVSAQAASLPAGFSDAAVARPDGGAWDEAAGLTYAADGRLFVWERGGRVWLIGGESASRQPIIDLQDEVSTIGSLGLTGFALDPQFETNGYLYLFYAVDPQHLADCAAPTFGPPQCGITFRAGRHATSGATLARLTRYQLALPKGAINFRLATRVNNLSRRVLLGETPAGGGVPAGCVITHTAHGAGGLAFGSDGTLFAGCGDGASALGEDSGANPDTEYSQALAVGLMGKAENVGAFRAQLVDSLSGKILRLNPATGDGIASNPFYDRAAPRAARSRVWVLGLRDPQHLSVRPGSGSAPESAAQPGTLYIGDTGANSWESLAVARTGRTNFGWPLYEGVGNDTTAYAGAAAFNLDAPNPLFQKSCSQQYFRFQDLITAPSLATSWPNPCRAKVEVPATANVFVRERPAIDWLHDGLDARWAASDDAGEPLALNLGSRAPNGEIVTGPLFGGTGSIGGAWYAGASFPAPYGGAYFHADSGGEWIKAFAFDSHDSPVAVYDFLGSGGAIRALAFDGATGAIGYVTGSAGSEVRRVTYAAPVAAPAVAPVVARAAAAAPVARGTAVSASSGATSRTTMAVAQPGVVALATASWSNGDIGSVGAAGSYSASGSTFTVKGAGVDIWGSADAFQFVSQPLTGDGSITARVVSQTNSNSWAKAGVMFRETLATGATNALAAVSTGNGAVFQARTKTGGSTAQFAGPAVAAPYWVRVVRAGNTFTGYVSANGSAWTLVSASTISMASQAYVGLAVTSHLYGTLSTAVFDNITVSQAVPPPPPPTDTQAPTVPTGLAAGTVTASSISFSWSASTDLPNPGGSGVGGYYVYRNGNTATPFATVTSGTAFTDSSLLAATAYTYQVAAFDKASPVNVSSASTALAVTTQSASSSVWSAGDIGSVGAAGAYSTSGSTFSVKGAGADIWGTADGLQFVSEPLVGDGSITARVVSQTNTSSWAKAGVMIRETLASGATNAFTAVSTGNGSVLQARAKTGGATAQFAGPAVAAPYWVRVVRAGNTFTGYVSPDGGAWTLVSQYTISMATQAFAGLAVTSHDYGVLSTAVFDNVTVGAAVAPPPPPPDKQAPTVPSGLTAGTVTASSIAFSWTASTDLPNPGGSGVGGYYVYRNGNTATAFATVTSGTTFTDTSLNAATAYTYQVAAFDKAAPANVSAPSGILSVTTKSASASSWSGGDIGSVGAAGSSAVSGSTFTVKGAGSDIWGTADGLQFISQPFTGDGTITARVVSQTNPNSWAKAGVMFRETLAAGAADALMAVSTGNGAVLQARNKTGGTTAQFAGPAVVAPYWVRLVRSGSSFAGYTSPDGAAWSFVSEYSVAMASQVYVGLAVTSHDYGVLSSAVFDNVSVTAGPPSNIGVTVTPSAPTLFLGTALQFSASLQNATNQAVTWAVNGVTGGSATTGTIDSTGLYVAPTSLVSAPTTFTITATSVQDTTRFGAAAVTVVDSAGVIVTPHQASLTLSQTAVFTAATNGGGVTWSVDGIAGGNTSVGTISTTGLYKPSTKAGAHTVTATSTLNSASFATASVAVTDLAGVYTYHMDIARTGANQQEYALTPAAVSGGTFGKRWSCALDGQVYGQPLYVANLSIGGAVHNVLILVTEHDSVYAIDADASNCLTYWQVSYLTAGVTTVPVIDSNCSDITVEYGITGTPVIDPASKTLYLVANTKESGSYVQRLHALDLATGKDKTEAAVIEASFANASGSAISFSALLQNQRPALALNDGAVYIGWSSHCDNGTYWGWMMRYDATTLAQTAVLNVTPNGSKGGIWMSGGAPAIDSSGSVYFTTGNGTFDDTLSLVPAVAPKNDFGEAFLKVDPSGLMVQDFYAPSQEAAWSNLDLDISASGVTVLPDGAGPATHPNVLVGSDKQGHLWLIDRTQMQRFSSTSDNVVQYLTLVANCGKYCFYSTPTYWNGTLYVSTVDERLMALPLTNGLVAVNAQNFASPASTSKDTFLYPAPTLMISASPAGGGILWALENNANLAGPAILRAYDATNLATRLYTSSAVSADAAGPAVKFTVPVIANGHVYVVGGSRLTVYGLAP